MRPAGTCRVFEDDSDEDGESRPACTHFFDWENAKRERRKQVSNLWSAIESGQIEEVKLYAQRMQSVSREITAAEVVRAGRHKYTFTYLNEVLEVLAEHGLDIHAVTAMEICHIIYANRTDPDDLVEKKFFHMDIPYTFIQPESNPLFIAAMKHKTNLVNLYLTGKGHTVAEEATAMELMEISSLLTHGLPHTRSKGLGYFRRAQQLRSQHQLEREYPTRLPCFETVEDVDRLEQSLQEEFPFEFLIECHIIAKSLSVSGLLGYFYDLQDTWIYMHAKTHLQMLKIFNHLYTPTNISLAEVQMLEKYYTKLERTEPPSWKEFYAMSYALRKADMQPCRMPVDIAIPDIAAIPKLIVSPMLSNVVNFMLRYLRDRDFPMSIAGQRMTAMIFELIEAGANILFSVDSYPIVHRRMREQLLREKLITEEDFWFLPLEPVYDEWLWPEPLPKSVLGRITLLNSFETYSVEFRDRIHRLVHSEHCCRLDRVGAEFRRPFPFEVSRLFCLASGVLPEENTHNLPPVLENEILVHRRLSPRMPDIRDLPEYFFSEWQTARYTPGHYPFSF